MGHSMEVSQADILWAQELYDALWMNVDFTSPDWWKATHDQSIRLQAYLNDCGYYDVETIERIMVHYNAAIDIDYGIV